MVSVIPDVIYSNAITIDNPPYSSNSNSSQYRTIYLAGHLFLFIFYLFFSVNNDFIDVSFKTISC